MGILDGLEQLFNMIQGLLINIPVDNTLGIVYVVMNIFAGIFALLTGGSFGDIFNNSLF